MATAPIQIKLRCASWQQLSAIYKRDLTRSAVFLKSSNPPPIGTAVQVNLTLPTESLVVLNGTVKAHVPEGGLGGRGPGIDIGLHSIPQSAMWLIESALAAKRDDKREDRSQVSPPPGPPPASPLAALGQAQPPAAPPPTMTAGARQARPRAPSPPAVEISMEDGEDLVTAEGELVRALAEEFESLTKLNPFQVLGVGYGASDDEVRTAFGELTKRYHPDRYARYQSGEARNIAAEIFILIRDAYRRLGDVKTRAVARASIEQKRAPTVIGTPAMPVAATPRPAAARPRAPISLPPIPPPPSSAPPRPVPPAIRPTTAESESEFVDLDLDSDDPPPPPPPAAAEPPPRAAGPDRRSAGDYGNVDALLDAGKYDEALAVFKINAKRNPSDRHARAGAELAEGLKALAQRDRLEAAQRFEVVLELDPGNERAARELAEMRRQATNERKGLLSRLLGKKE